MELYWYSLGNFDGLFDRKPLSKEYRIIMGSAVTVVDVEVNMSNVYSVI